MSVTCSQVPTLTATETRTSQSLEVTTTATISTVPGAASIILVTGTCTAPPRGVTSTCEPPVSTITTTLPGTTTTVTIPWTVTHDVPVTTINTLWGQSCTTIPLPPGSVPPPNTWTQPPASTPTTSGTSYTSNTSNTSNTSTNTSLNPNPSPSGNTLQPDNAQKKSTPVGPIVGGVLGGLAVIILVGVLTWKYIKNRPSWDDIFDADDGKEQGGSHYVKKTPPIGDKPYEYGQLNQAGGLEAGHGGNGLSSGYGSQGGNGFSPDATQITQEMGPSTTQASGPTQSPVAHLRNPSLAPLLAGAAGAAAGLGAGAAASSSRPSSSDSSSLNTGPVVQHAPPFQGYVPPQQTMSYPPQVQNYSQTQYSPGPSSPPISGYASTQQPSLTHGMSVGSSLSGPSTYSPSSWSHGPAFASGAAAMMAGPSNQRPMQPQQQYYPQQQPYQHGPQSGYQDPFQRSGSPVSIQEQRILQVTNADPASSEYGYDASLVAGPSAMFGGAATAGPSTSGAGTAGLGTTAAVPSSSATSSPGPSQAAQVDGKGRPLNTAGDKAAVVHLDGGAYQEPAPGTTQPPPGPAPPAYDF